MTNIEQLINFLKTNNFDFIDTLDQSIDIKIHNQLFHVTIKNNLIDFYIKTSDFSIWEIDYYYSVKPLQDFLLAIKAKENQIIHHISFCSGFFICNNIIFFLTTRGCKLNTNIFCMGWTLGQSKIDPVFQKRFKVKNHYQILTKELEEIIHQVSIEINPAMAIIKQIDQEIK